MDKEKFYQSLLTFLNEPKPRKVPDQFVYSNPIAGLFIVLGGILTTMLLCMSILFVILHVNGLMRGNSSLYGLFLPAIMSLIPLFLLLYGLLNKNKSVKYLESAELAKGACNVRLTRICSN